jgi:hypothetical protein
MSGLATVTPFNVAFDATVAAGSDALDSLTVPATLSDRERVTTLLHIYGLHLDPVTVIGDRAAYTQHPAVVHIKTALEARWLAELSATPPPEDLPDDAVAAIRALGARDRLPEVYNWLATTAGADEVVDFLALEGGPDAGFDDLVALCQVGISGAPKVELARNYWDELGEGDPEAVHTRLYEQLVDAIDLPRLDHDEQPLAGLERSALGGLLATNRWLHPEFIGALGMTELQAGPRCRRVLQAFDRIGAPRAAYAFYEVHAEVDPRHGRDWLDNVVGPLSAYEGWGERMLRGAWWRHRTNGAFFASFAERLDSRAA